MKNIATIIGGAMVAIVALASPAWAAGTVTPALDENSGTGLYVITMTATADASDGSYPAAVSTEYAVDGFLCRVIVDPDDSTTPTDNFDATLLDQYGVDVMEGALANMDTDVVTAVDYVPTVNGGAATGCVLVRGPLFLTVTGNSVNSAVAVFRLLVLR